jgi:ABC-type Zn uptake system ZnuABC Zn-binding protein ZnuA
VTLSVRNSCDGINPLCYSSFPIERFNQLICSDLFGWLFLRYFPEDVLKEVLDLAALTANLKTATEVQEAFLILKDGKIAGILLFATRKTPKKLMKMLEEELEVPVYAITPKKSGYTAFNTEGERIPLEPEEVEHFVDLVF